MVILFARSQDPFWTRSCLSRSSFFFYHFFFLGDNEPRKKGQGKRETTETKVRHCERRI